ncbi:hypothetical protein BH10BAC2_BH10BAC2_36280 [soil metagenome]
MKNSTNELVKEGISPTDDVINMDDVNPDGNKKKSNETKNFAEVLSENSDENTSSDDTDADKTTTDDKFPNNENGGEEIEKLVDENTPTMAAIPDDNEKTNDEEANT